jgi:hypothetical protein
MLPTFFGRLVPPDMDHVVKYGFHLLGIQALTHPVEVELDVPDYHDWYDQARFNAQGCVAFSLSNVMSIYNRKLYNPMELYWAAQDTDGDPNTTREANNGTYLRAGFHVLKTMGHWEVRDGLTLPVSLQEGIAAYYWASSIDEARTALAGFRRPIDIGVNWYDAFCTPPPDGVLGRQKRWGKIVGGHAICVSGFSDDREAFHLVNTLGPEYPLRTWLPYRIMERLLHEDGEIGIAIDRT